MLVLGEKVEVIVVSQYNKSAVQMCYIPFSKVNCNSNNLWISDSQVSLICCEGAYYMKILKAPIENSLGMY